MRFETPDPGRRSKAVYSPRMASSKKPVKTAKPAKSKAKSKTSAGAAQRRAAPVRTPADIPPDVASTDPALFDPLTPGEVADALRTLTEDRRLGSMAKVGRYRVICSEPLVVKPPHWMAGHRLARVIAYDYAADRTVDACVDLDAGVVAHLELTRAQPMLSREEEALAVSIAMVDSRVREKLALGDTAQSALHYWGRGPEDLAFARRSAAVVFGRADGHASVVAVVDLLENMVTQVVPAERW
jgi:Cu2+-containing amine oxidase